jgi:hypothetical protein
LKEKKPQATFSCNAETEECNFQCKHFTQLTAQYTANGRSLGRSERILLLRPRHVLLPIHRRVRPQHHEIPMRKHKVRMRSG